MKNKKVLVVVCAFNEQDSILICLESLKSSIAKNQLESRVSVVCVDNSSTDKTSEIASGFTKSNTGFNYVKIEHCNLCVSRNTYKFFDGFDYVAYIDGDGYIAEDWTRMLIHIIDNNPGAHIISGPVFDLESKNENLIWELYFDSELYGTKDYLIGANMIFSRGILDKVDGFPSFFPVRGDESSLLLRIRNLNIEINHVFEKDLVTYNFFTDDLTSFLKTQYTDGKRSYDISQLNGTYKKTKLNGVLKLITLVLLLLSLVLIALNPALGLLCFIASIGPFLYRHRIYAKNLLSKVRKPKPFVKIKFASAILLSRYLFDAGFLSKFFDRRKVTKEMLDETQDPVVLEKIDG